MLSWGINKYTDDKTGKVTYDMSLQFPKSEYNTEELSSFLKAMQNFEEKIKNTAMENSKEWMNKAKMSQEVVDALWSAMLKYPKYSKKLLIDNKIIIKKYITHLITKKYKIINISDIKDDLHFLYYNINISNSNSVNYLYYLLSNK